MMHRGRTQNVFAGDYRIGKILAIARDGAAIIL